MMPHFFGYGANKPVRFHSDKFAKTLLEKPNCAVKPYNTGHWVMHEKSQELSEDLVEWLKETD
jgi:hypothetical protein